MSNTGVESVEIPAGCVGLQAESGSNTILNLSYLQLTFQNYAHGDQYVKQSKMLNFRTVIMIVTLASFHLVVIMMKRKKLFPINLLMMTMKSKTAVQSLKMS